MEIMGSQGLNIESLINNVSADMSQGDLEDKKVSKASVRANTEKIHDKRQERIKNLIDQMKGVAGPGGCMKILRVVAGVLDFLVKPLSALTLNKLKLDLSKTLDALQDSKNQKKILGMRIDGEQIQKALQGLKKLLGNDMETLKTQDERGAKETERILQILDEIDSSFKSAGKI